MKHNLVKTFGLCLTVLLLIAACSPSATPLPPTPTATTVPTSTPVPTDTPAPTDTPRPTNTPRPSPTPRPTNTPQPTANAPSGFKPIAGDGITLWLPESYDGGSLTGKDRELLLASLTKLGGQFANMAKQFEAMKDKILLFAYDSHVNARGGMTNVNVVEIPIFSTIKPLTLAEMLAAQLPNQIKGIKVGEAQEVDLLQYPAASLTAQMVVNRLSIKEIMYIVKVGDTSYMITYATDAQQFDKLLSDFEQSVQTFTVNP